MKTYESHPHMQFIFRQWQRACALYGNYSRAERLWRDAYHNKWLQLSNRQ